MTVFFYALFGWMPPVLQIVCCGVVAIFFIFTALHIVRLIFDLIPFL